MFSSILMRLYALQRHPIKLIPFNAYALPTKSSFQDISSFITQSRTACRLCACVYGRSVCMCVVKRCWDLEDNEHNKAYQCQKDVFSVSVDTPSIFICFIFIFGLCLDWSLVVSSIRNPAQLSHIDKVLLYFNVCETLVISDRLFESQKQIEFQLHHQNSSVYNLFDQFIQHKCCRDPNIQSRYTISERTATE